LFWPQIQENLKIKRKMFKILEKTKEKIKKNKHFIILAALFILFIFAYLFDYIVITIDSGEGGVKFRRFSNGTEINHVYGEGIHLIFPWDKMYIYNIRVQQIAHDFYVLSKSGLKVHLLISIRYYPEYELIGVLHQSVGPDYAEKVVVPEIESVLRIIVGKLNAEEVYTTETALIENALNEGIEQVAQRFIKIDDVIIKRIILPDAVENAIQKKIEEKHKAEAFIFRIEKEIREAERKRIEATGLKDYNKIVNSSLSDKIITWKGIDATLQLAKSDNSKIVVIGNSKGLPLIGSIPLDTDNKDRAASALSFPAENDLVDLTPEKKQQEEIPSTTGLSKNTISGKTGN
jgi:regulator of protease activity HflC (stomatin/prohibitin superfamily)